MHNGASLGLDPNCPKDRDLIKARSGKPVGCSGDSHFDESSRRSFFNENKLLYKNARYKLVQIYSARYKTSYCLMENLG